MKKPISFHPDVAEDIKGSYNWYENQLQGLGKRFLDELEDAYMQFDIFLNHGQTFSMALKGIS